MSLSKRNVLTGCLVFLTGCTRLRSQGENENTTNPPKDYSLADLRISNIRTRPVDATVSFVPEGDPEPTIELSIRLPSEDSIIWDDNPLLDNDGQVTVTADDGTGEPLQEESRWHGDSIDDNRRLVVLVEEDEVTIEQHTA